MYDNLSCVHKDNNTATEQVKAPVKAPKNCVVGTCCWLRNMLSNRERFQCIWMYMAVGVVMCCLNCIWCPNLFHLFVPYGPCFCIFLVHEVYLCICNLFDLWLMMVSCRAYFHPPKNILYFEFVCLAHFLPVLRHLFYRSHDINRNNKKHATSSQCIYIYIIHLPILQSNSITWSNKGKYAALFHPSYL